jgi:hypothetical protein
MKEKMDAAAEVSPNKRRRDLKKTRFEGKKKDERIILEKLFDALILKR